MIVYQNLIVVNSRDGVTVIVTEKGKSEVALSPGVAVVHPETTLKKRDKRKGVGNPVAGSD